MHRSLAELKINQAELAKNGVMLKSRVKEYNQQTNYFAGASERNKQLSREIVLNEKKNKDLAAQSLALSEKIAKLQTSNADLQKSYDDTLKNYNRISSCEAVMLIGIRPFPATLWKDQHRMPRPTRLPWVSEPS